MATTTNNKQQTVTTTTMVTMFNTKQPQATLFMFGRLLFVVSCLVIPQVCVVVNCVIGC